MEDGFGLVLAHEACSDLCESLGVLFGEEPRGIDTLSQKANVIGVIFAAADIKAFALLVIDDELFIPALVGIVDDFLRLLDRALIFQHVQDLVDLVNVPVNAAAFGLDPAIFLQIADDF